MSYSVVIPTLNERKNLEKLLPSILGSGVEVLVCDNGSTDGTVEVAQRLGARTCIGSGSVGEAVLRGIRYASCNRIIVMDGDLSHPVGAVGHLANALVEHDLVVGSRCADGGYSRDSFRNRVISWIGNVVGMGLAPGVRDRMSGFWGMKRELRDRVVGARPTAKPMLEFLVRGGPSSMAEIGYGFSPRSCGTSKIGRSWSLWETFFDLGRLYTVKYGKVLKFGTVSGIGLGINLGLLFFLTEVVGLWYGASAGIAVVSALIWNFTMHNLWTWGKCKSLEDLWNLGHKVEDGNFEWWEWYGPNPVKRWWKHGVANKTKSLVGNHEDKRILVLGCGSSPSMNLYHCEKVGVELVREKAEFLRNHSDATIFTRDITKPLVFDGSDRKFDIILCNEVLEHLSTTDLQVVVRNMEKLLSPTGSIIVSIPDYASRVGNFIERVMHSDMHNPITSALVRSMFRDRGYTCTGKSSHMWVVVQRFERVARA